MVSTPTGNQPVQIDYFIRIPVKPRKFQINITVSPPPRTCLSCGAKTNTAGELPCGH